MTNDHWAERKRGRGPERMVTGPARDALIDLFAERYPEPGTPAHASEREPSAFDVAVRSLRWADEAIAVLWALAVVVVGLRAGIACAALIVALIAIDVLFGRKRTGRTR